MNEKRNLNKEEIKSPEKLKNENDAELEINTNLNKINDEITSSSYDLNTISNNKTEKIITLDTLVYEILNPGESRAKNYDKISAEIKNAEQMAKIEKAKLKKKLNLMNQRLNQNMENKEINITN